MDKNPLFHAVIIIKTGQYDYTRIEKRGILGDYEHKQQ